MVVLSLQSWYMCRKRAWDYFHPHRVAEQWVASGRAGAGLGGRMESAGPPAVAPPAAGEVRRCCRQRPHYHIAQAFTPEKFSMSPRPPHLPFAARVALRRPTAALCAPAHVLTHAPVNPRRAKLALLLGDGPVEPAVPLRPVPIKPSQPTYANPAKAHHEQLIQKQLNRGSGGGGGGSNPSSPQGGPPGAPPFAA